MHHREAHAFGAEVGSWKLVFWDAFRTLLHVETLAERMDEIYLSLTL